MEAIKARRERYGKGPGSKVTRTGAPHKAAEIYDAQLRGQIPKQRGALLPGMKAAGQRARNANVVRGAKPKVGAPKGGTGSRIKAKSTRAGAVAAPTSPNARQRARAAAKIKLSPMQRSEAKYAKRKYGVSSTVSNPGRPSIRMPRKTTSTGARIAVRGNKAATSSAYKQRISGTLNRTRTGSIGIGGVRNNPRIRRVDTGMRQLNMLGSANPLYRYPRVKASRR